MKVKITYRIRKYSQYAKWKYLKKYDVINYITILKDEKDKNYVSENNFKG